jgi:hypothetical protein
VTELERIWAGAPVRIDDSAARHQLIMLAKGFEMASEDRETGKITSAVFRDDEALTRLLGHYVGLLRSSTRRFVTLPLADARQMALLALLVAVDRYEGESGDLPRLASAVLDVCWTAVGADGTVAVPGATMRRFRAALRKSGGLRAAIDVAEDYGISPASFRMIAASRHPMPLDPVWNQDVGDMFATDTGELAGRARACLPEKLRRVVDYGFGFVDGVPHTDVETAERLGMSPQSVQRARQKALAAMRVELGVGAVV